MSLQASEKINSPLFKLKCRDVWRHKGCKILKIDFFDRGRTCVHQHQLQYNFLIFQKVKVWIWYNPIPLPCQYLVVLYNLTPVGNSPNLGVSHHLEVIQISMQLTSQAGLVQVLSYPMFCWYSYYLPTEGWKAESTPSQVEWVWNLGPVAWWSIALPTELSQLALTVYLETYALGVRSRSSYF